MRHYTTGLTKLKLGPIIRRESSLRFYNNYFNKNVTLSSITLKLLYKIKKVKLIKYKNSIDKTSIASNCIYLFNEIPHWSDYFLNIRENRQLVINEFFQTINSKILDAYKLKNSPEIGVHIRMGDFKKLDVDIDFSKVGHTRTPLQYFSDIICLLRSGANKNLAVTIFSDGKKEDLEPILKLPNTQLAEDDLDIVQMLHLSKSKIIILSAGSTFGQWAAYLSNAVIINHYQHFHNYIRPYNDDIFEGIIEPSANKLPQLLLNNLQHI